MHMQRSRTIFATLGSRTIFIPAVYVSSFLLGGVPSFFLAEEYREQKHEQAKPCDYATNDGVRPRPDVIEWDERCRGGWQAGCISWVGDKSEWTAIAEPVTIRILESNT